MQLLFTFEPIEVSITTPALLFSASAFLLLSFTNRYVTLANRIRSLCEEYEKHPREHTKQQILILDKRVDFLRFMQLIIISSLFAGVLSMFLLYLKLYILGVVVFGVSLILLCVSLLFTVHEINISSKALKIHIRQLLHSKGESID